VHVQMFNTLDISPHSNHPTFRSFPCFFYHRSRANYGAESGLQGSPICTCHSTYAVARDVLIQRPTGWVGFGFSIVDAVAIVAVPAREKLKFIQGNGKHANKC
jgi:hypothetical protein